LDFTSFKGLPMEMMQDLRSYSTRCNSAELTKTTTAFSPLASALLTNRSVGKDNDVHTYLTNTQQLFSRARCATPAVDNSRGADELRQKRRALSH
jgi:hypothetical protein